jgi:hypothetical protein
VYDGSTQLIYTISTPQLENGELVTGDEKRKANKVDKKTTKTGKETYKTRRPRSNGLVDDSLLLKPGTGN